MTTMPADASHTAPLDGAPAGCIRTVEVTAIDLTDERYRLTSGRPDRGLIASVTAIGCIVPPICVALRGHPSNGTLIAVAGFRRIEALRGLGSGAVRLEVRVVDPETSTIELLKLAALDQRRDGDLTPFQRARAMRRALALDCSRSEVAADLLPALGLEPHESVIKRHLKLQRVPVELAELLEVKGASLRRALRFVQTMPAEASLLVELCEGLNLSLRALEECAQRLADVARRDDRSWRAVAESVGLVEAAAGSGPVDQRARPALERLWRMRYPAWAVARARAEELVEAVDPPEGVSFSWDPRFEAEGLTVTLRARTMGELQNQLEGLTEVERLERLSTLFEAL